MEAIVEHDFASTESDELSLQKGQIVKVLNSRDDPHWWKAELEGHEGYVPSNYIKMVDNPWYMGAISRQESENLLRSSSVEEGQFLVRDCQSSPGDFSLSVKFNGGVQHLKFLRDNGGKYFLYGSKFSSINEIVAHHRNCTISRHHQVLLKDLNQFVQAQFDFTAQDQEELSFKKGDIIRVLDTRHDSWWEGTLNDVTGIFPSNYVAPVRRV